MVIFATLGAIMAYRAAGAEHNNTILERKLAYGHLLEAIERQKELDGIVEDALLGARLSMIRQAGLSKREAADRLRQAKPATAAWLDLQAQEEFAARRAILQFWQLTPSSEECLSLGNLLQWKVSPILSELGFETDWHDPRPATDCEIAQAKQPAKSILDRLERKIYDGHEQIPKLAMTVVLFVGALVCLTLAELSAGIWYKGAWLTGGVIAGTVSAAYTYSIDDTYRINQPSWHLLILAMGTFIMLYLLMWYFGFLRPSKDQGRQPLQQEVEPRSQRYPELPHEAGDGFSRFTIFAIAFTVFLSAVSGYCYSVAETASGRATTRALRQEADMSARSSRLGAALVSETSQYATYIEAQMRRASIKQQLDAPGVTPLLDVETARADDLTQYLINKKQWGDWINDQEFGIEHDPNFPRRLVREEPYLALDQNGVLKNNAWEPFAMWDAESSESLSWHNKAAVFLAALTLFAIALYLLGQGYSMGRGGAASVLIVFGVLFALVGLGRGLYAQYGYEESEKSPLDSISVSDECHLDAKDVKRFGPEPKRVQELAARHFAIGKVLLDSEDTTSYKEVRNHLRCVVRLRPDFTAAYVALANAENLLDSVEVGSRYVSLPKRESVAAIVEAKRAALEQFHQKDLERPPHLLMGFAFDNLLGALPWRDRNDLAKSVDAATQAVRSSAAAGDTYRFELPWLQSNRGLILLANGDIDGARQAYAAAFQDPQPEPALIASAITDLETLVRSCKYDLSPAQCARPFSAQIDQLAESLVLIGTVGKPPKPDKAIVLNGLDISATPANFHARLELRDFDLSQDQLAILWYAWEPAWNSWRVLQGNSGPIPAEELHAESDGWLSVRRSHLLKTKECLDSGRYRADIYVNGKRVGTNDEIVQPIPAFEASKFLKLNLILCRPRGWLRLPWSEVDPKYGDDELINE